METQTKNMTIGLIMSWILGVILLFTGVLIIFAEIVSGIFLILSALVVLPPVTRTIKEKYNFRLRKSYRIFVVIILLVLAGITNGGEENVETNYATSPIIQKSTEVFVPTVFDVPPLVGKDLGELRTILGTPDYDNEPTATYIQKSDIRTWEKTWNKSGYSLSATYNIDTKKIIELFLGSDSDASLVVFRDKNNILKVGNLSTDSPLYSLEFVELKAILGKPKFQTPEGYTGVIVRAK